MEESKAKTLVKKVFKLINESKEVKDLDDFKSFNEVPKSILTFYERTNKNYPEINFTFSKEEIDTIKKSFPNFNTEEFDNPFTKLFYAMIWKQDDLPKIKHIINGLNGVDKNDAQGMVLYHFGRFLADKSNNYIVDQHVVRAFKAKTNIDEFDKYRQLDSLTNKTHKKYIDEYQTWMKDFRTDLKGETRQHYLFKVDRILMALGKAIKKTK